MAIVLQIGAGGVGGVVAHKMAMNKEVFSRIILASRTLSKCKAIADSIHAKGYGEIEIDVVNADSVESVVALIEKYRPHLVVNVALPYQDLTIMEACLRTKTHYLDTANYEHPDSAHFEYKEQWAYDTRYKQAGIFALLGSGFDPGVTNVFCAYAQKHYFDTIYSIDILDCNAGDHGYAFATNFNPEINLREVSSKARYWVKDSSLGNLCGSSHLSHCAARQNASHSLTSHNPQVSSTILECGDSGNGDCGGVDSKGKNTESKALVSQTDLALNPDLKQDSIYRKFEREERHWEQEVAEKAEVKLAKRKMAQNTNEAGASLGDFKGYQVRSEGSLVGLNNQAECVDSLKSVKEVTHYCGGMWRDIAPLALMKEWDYPEVGVKNSYLLYHEELESLIRNIKGLQKIRFFMTFGESYLTHMKVLENIGFLRIDEVNHKGSKIVPIEVLKTLLPDPASLASRTKGQTHIGCYIKGIKDGKERTIYIYNICEHEKCFAEVNAQGVSYTTGVPAMIGAKLICEGKWGVGAQKNVSLTQSLQEFEKSSINRHTALSQSDFSAQPANLKQNTHSLDSKDSNTESYNAQRLKLNADMPKGGEYQGIDNAVELCELDYGNTEAKKIERNSKIIDEKSVLRSCECGDKSEAELDSKCHKAGASLDDFKGYQARGEASVLDINNQVECVDSLKSVKETTQGAGVWNMEQNDPDPFMVELNKQGLPYVVLEIESSGDFKVLEDGRRGLK